MKLQPDDGIIGRALGNDKMAQEELFIYIVHIIRPILRSRFDLDHVEDIEDGIMDALFKFFSNPPANIQTLPSLTAWTITVVKNYVFDQIRKKTHECSLEVYDISLGNERKLHTASLEETLIKSFANGEFKVHLNTVLDESRPEDRHILQRYYLDRIALDAIANEMKLPVTTVKKRKERILSRIHHYFVANGSSINNFL